MSHESISTADARDLAFNFVMQGRGLRELKKMLKERNADSATKEAAVEAFHFMNHSLRQIEA